MEKEQSSEYKEDSTRGSSLINPISYKGDVLVQVWMDSRVLATLCKWLEGNGEYPRFLSHVIRMPLEMLAAHMVDKGEVEIVDDTIEARTLLEGRFHVSLNKGKRGKKNLLHNVVLSSRRGTDLGKGGLIDYTRHEPEPVKRSQEEVRADYFKEQAKKEKMKEIVEAEKKKARDSGLVVEEDGTPITSCPSVKEGMSEEEYEDKMEEIKERDKDRLELEKGAEISEDNIVKEEK